MRVCSGSRSGVAGSGPVPWTRSTPGGRSIRSPPPASSLVAFIQARVPGASVTTDAGDAAEPVEAADRVGDQQRGGQAPVAGQQAAPGGDDAELDHDDRHAVEQRLDAVLADRCVDPPAVDAAQVLRAPAGWRRRA